MKPEQDVVPGIVFSEDLSGDGTGTYYSDTSGAVLDIVTADITQEFVAAANVDNDSPNASPAEREQKIEAYIDAKFKLELPAGYKPDTSHLGETIGMLGVAVAPWMGLAELGINAAASLGPGIAAAGPTVAELLKKVYKAESYDMGAFDSAPSSMERAAERLTAIIQTLEIQGYSPKEILKIMDGLTGRGSYPR